MITKHPSRIGKLVYALLISGGVVTSPGERSHSHVAILRATHRRLKRHLLGLSLIAIAGCSSIPMPQTQGMFKDDITPLLDESIVFVFRNQFALGGGGPTQISINRQEALRVNNRGYSVLRLKAGCYEFDQRWLSQDPDVYSRTQRLCFDAGSKNYVRIFAEIRGARGFGTVTEHSFGARLVSLPYAEAIPSIRECELYPATGGDFIPILPTAGAKS